MLTQIEVIRELLLRFGEELAGRGSGGESEQLSSILTDSRPCNLRRKNPLDVMVGYSQEEFQAMAALVSRGSLQELIKKAGVTEQQNREECLEFLRSERQLIAETLKMPQ